MGFLRSILALSVLLSHAGGIPLRIYGVVVPYLITGADIAVQGFYIISGFYMALILSDKYTTDKGGLYFFYTNRMWRLMPVYFLSIIATFILSLLWLNYDIKPLLSIAYYISHLQDHSFISILISIFVNFSIIGQDLVCLNPDSGIGIFLPQSWTLSLEIYFYLIIPFIIKRTRIMIGLVIFSSFMRIYLYSKGFSQGNIWEYGFFPNELALFLLGSLSYKLYEVFRERKIFSKLNVTIIPLILFILTFCFPLLMLLGRTFTNFLTNAQLIYFSAVFLGLPFLFHLSKKSRIDRFIGELSYPIYLSHLMIIDIFTYFLKIESPLYLSIVTTIIVSSIIVILIQRPVDRYRHNRFSSSNLDKQSRWSLLIQRWFDSLPKSNA